MLLVIPPYCQLDYVGGKLYQCEINPRVYPSPDGLSLEASMPSGLNELTYLLRLDSVRINKTLYRDGGTLD